MNTDQGFLSTGNTQACMHSDLQLSSRDLLPLPKSCLSRGAGGRLAGCNECPTMSGTASECEQNSLQPKEWHAVVFYRGRRGVLTYFEATDKLVLVQKSLKYCGKNKTLLDIPMHTVLNVETSDERFLRELQREKCNSAAQVQASCTPLGRFFSFSFSPLMSGCLCMDPNVNDLSNNDVKILSAPTESSGDRISHLLRCPQWSLHDDVSSADASRSALSPLQQCGDGIHETRSIINRALGQESSQPRLSHYFLYYVSLKSLNSSKRSIHGVEFCIQEDPDHLRQMENLVSAILFRICPSGPKNFEIFISPNSGRGRGEDIYRNHLRPILDYSRHKLKVTVTNYAHQCEDYVADLKNTLDKHYVVVVVGGDGMMHEVVNGLHRRKLALIAQMRAECSAPGLHLLQPESPMKEPPCYEEPCEFGADMQAGGLRAEERAAFLCAEVSCAAERPKKLERRQTLTPVSDAFLRGGWDALMPLSAIIPSGSACGLAKVLSVMNFTKTALSLVHLTTCRMDLLSMRFEPNPDQCSFHWKRWSVEKRARAIKSYAAYRRLYAGEINERLAPRAVAAPYSRPILSANAGQSDSLVGVGPCHSHPDFAALKGNMSTRSIASPNPAEVVTNASWPTTRTTVFAAASSNAESLPPSPPWPFFKDGTPLYTDPVSYKLGAPEIKQRVAFMSLSFGMPNDIDRGSEPLRWMGNARFAVFGGLLLLSGVRKYKASIRYLPWTSDKNLELRNSKERNSLASFSPIPFCTLRDSCPHCLNYAEPSLTGLELVKRYQRGATPTSFNCQEDLQKFRAVMSDGSIEECGEAGRVKFFSGAGGGRPAEVSSSSIVNNTQRKILMSCSDAELLQEDQINFASESLPWATLDGEFIAVVLCNLRNVSQDMIMAPLSHFSDGAIDLVLYRNNPHGIPNSQVTRKGVYDFFKGMEDGTHVKHPSISYIKTRAVEIKVDSGISMSDGEMMPLSLVRVSKIRNGVRIVRSD